MELDDLKVYQLSMDIADRIWMTVHSWDSFAKSTIGKQLTRSADSIVANISEGYGRYFYKENKRFCYYSRGSLYETRTWLQKAYHRRLIDQAAYAELQRDLDTATRMLNGYIRSIGRQKHE